MAKIYTTKFDRCGECPDCDVSGDGFCYLDVSMSLTCAGASWVDGVFGLERQKRDESEW